ncbi:MAG: hypothetical protein WBF71_06610 [Microthrixaceae bacterium]
MNGRYILKLADGQARSYDHFNAPDSSKPSPDTNRIVLGVA